MLLKEETIKKNVFVENQLRGEKMRWDKVTKVKYRNWDDICKDITLKGKSQEFHLKASTSLLQDYSLLPNQTATLI